MACPHLNLSAISGLRLGDFSVTAAYLGEQQVWPCGIRLYFNGAVDNDWNTLGNWWQDAGFSVPATELPGLEDNAVITTNVLSNSGTAIPAVANLEVQSGDFEIDAAVTGNAIFGNTNLNFSASNFGILLVPNGVVTFENDALNNGTVTGNAVFEGTSINRGTVDGNAVFREQSKNQEGVVIGVATFEDDSCNVNGAGTFGLAIPDPPPNCTVRTLYFNAATDNDWSTLGNWWADEIFTQPVDNLPQDTDSVVISANVTTNSSENTPTVLGLTATNNAVLDIMINVIGVATFNNNSSIGPSGSIPSVTGSSAVFNNFSVNYGTSPNNSTFNDDSTNKGIVAGLAVFNNASANDSGTVTGLATFNDSSCDVGASGTFGVVSPDPAPLCDRGYTARELNAWPEGAEFSSVIGTYCADGTWNNRPRYKLIVDDASYYLVFVTDDFIGGTMAPATSWIVATTREPEYRDEFNHLWYAYSDADLPPHVLSWPPEGSPAFFLANQNVQAGAPEIAFVAARCNV